MSDTADLSDASSSVIETINNELNAVDEMLNDIDGNIAQLQQQKERLLKVKIAFKTARDNLPTQLEFDFGSAQEGDIITFAEADQEN